MAVRSLAYICIQARDLDAWRRYAEDVLGAAIAPESTADLLLVRFDGRPWRFRIERVRLGIGPESVDGPEPVDGPAAERTIIRFQWRDVRSILI